MQSSGRWCPRAVVAAVIKRDNSYLMVEEYIYGKAVLGQTNGHLEEGETLLQAVTREAREETGIDIAPTALIGVYRWVDPKSGVTQMRFTFAADIIEEYPDPVLDPAVINLHWMTRTAIEQAQDRLRNPLVMRAIRDYESGQRFALGAIQEVWF